MSDLTCASVVVGGHASRCPVVLYKGDDALSSSWQRLILIILLFTVNNRSVFVDDLATGGCSLHTFCA